jgi:hypothetical protein
MAILEKDIVQGIRTSVDLTITGGVDATSTGRLLLTDSSGRLQITGGASNLPTVDAADGTVNTTAPSIATQVGGQDSLGKLQPFNLDGSGNLKVTGGGGGTQYTDGNTQATPTGTVALGKNASNILHSLSLDGSGNLNVNLAAGTISGGNAAAGLTGAAVPTSGDYLAAKDGSGNLQGLLVESNTNPNLRISIYNGTTEASVTGANALKVDGSAVNQPVLGGNLAESTAAWTSATAGNTALQVNIAGYNSVAVTLNQGSTITGGVVTFEVSDTTAFTNAYPVQAVQTNAFTSGSTYTLVQSTNQAFEIDVGGFAAFRVRLSTVITGTGTVNVGIAANAMASDPSLVVGGTVTANAGTGTFNIQSNASVNVAQAAGTATDTNSGVKSAGTLRVVLATDQPALTNKLLVTPDSVALPANQSVNVSQLAGTTTDTNSGVKSAGTLRVVLATDQPALTNKLLVTPDSVALPANQSVNVSQINAVTPLMGNGVTGTGSPRVTIASDNTAFTVNAAQSGTWTVQPGNTANTTPWLVTQTPAVSGGCSKFHLVSAGTTNATNVKASAGQLFGWRAFNTNAATRYVKLHNSSGTPTAGASVVETIAVPAGGGSNGLFDTGVAFSTGIAITMVTGIADSDSAAVAANDLVLDLYYK